MLRRLLLVLSLVLPLAARAASAGSASVDERVRDLLAHMTIEEKAGQLAQFSSWGELTGPAANTPLGPRIEKGEIGSLLNVTGAAASRKWQELAVTSSRFHIPLLLGYDVIHGFRTVFPIPLASAASWDLDRIEHAEHIAAAEAASTGLNWTFAPMVDIARDPRWGRVAEGAGEDPFLGSAVARARVRGFQGSDLAAPDTILACVKHFAGYGAVQAGRDYFTTDITERVLRDVYLPPFHAAIEAGAGSIMAAFNDLDGTPASANALLLDRILRREWGFKGFVVSDWGTVRELMIHGYATDLKDAATKAFRAGLDMDMQADALGKYVPELVRAGVIPESRLDAAAGAILAAKFRLGLFDDPYRYSDEAREKATLLTPAHLDAARDLARRSCVLLKNNGVLPLAATVKSIALVGPLADNPRMQLGAWHAQGRAEEAVTLRAALEKQFPGAVHFAAGCDVRGDDTSGFAAARAAAQASDLVIAALGEADDQSGESSSRTSLDFTGPQLALLRELHAAGKPIVLLVMAGRPLSLEQAGELADAILVPWHPGTMAGPAIVDVLTGAYNPSGHLPISWPHSVGQVPIFYAHKNSGRPEPQNKNDRFYSHYLDAANTPQYSFGYGLSYTTFAFDDLRLDTNVLKTAGTPLKITVRVANTGQRDGEEVVQLYVRDLVGSVTRPVRELKGFQKIPLAAGESRDVTFSLTPADLAFWRADMTFGAEPGDFEVFVGDNSDAELAAKFKLE
ncbi:MAG TPA: glycoside hydrolase family 3 N-terminal domain-containing protein [Lacunisphaera sp.]|jgi:beta-glucosidase|nr:glycoside hydrolase family 3 N-terminal domain-containing protein [Lacunisphaera sp.]